MIDLRGRSMSQFLSETDLYKDLCMELQKENDELRRKIRKLVDNSIMSISSTRTTTGDTPT